MLLLTKAGESSIIKANDGKEGADMRQIEILDSSLRDGAQAEGIFIRWRISCELPMLWTASESDLLRR